VNSQGSFTGVASQARLFDSPPKSTRAGGTTFGPCFAPSAALAPQEYLFAALTALRMTRGGKNQG
jgi:hypothetical protein